MNNHDQDILRYRYGRDNPGKLVALFLACLIGPFIIFCVLPIVLFPEAFPWTLLLSGYTSVTLYRNLYKRMLAKHVKVNEAAGYNKPPN